MLTKNILNAINKARTNCCTARLTRRLSSTRRVYAVTTPEGKVYSVLMEHEEGQRFATCSCKASERGLGCYHLLSAANLDSRITGYHSPVLEEASASATDSLAA